MIRLKSLLKESVNEDMKSKARQVLSKSNYDEKQIWKLKDVVRDILHDMPTSSPAAKELKNRLQSDTNGLYAQTDETGGSIIFANGDQYDIMADQGGRISVTKK